MNTTYKTVQGDTWDIIAKKCYPKIGGEMQMDKLLEANTNYLNRVIFEAGIVLTVPEIETPVVNMPPWRKP